jgi:hypothetical protein
MYYFIKKTNGFFYLKNNEADFTFFSVVFDADYGTNRVNEDFYLES